MQTEIKFVLLPECKQISRIYPGSIGNNSRDLADKLMEIYNEEYKTNYAVIANNFHFFNRSDEISTEKVYSGSAPTLRLSESRYAERFTPLDFFRRFKEEDNINFEIELMIGYPNCELFTGTNLIYNITKIEQNLLYTFRYDKTPFAIVFNDERSKEEFLNGKPIYVYDSNNKCIWVDDRSRNYVIRMNLETEIVEAGYIGIESNIFIKDENFLDFPHSSSTDRFSGQIYKFKDSEINFYQMSW